MVRRDGHLVPAAEYDYQTIQRFPENKPLRVDVRQPRSLPHHRFFFAALQKVCEATGLWDDVEDLLWAIKFHMKMFDEVVISADGKVTLRPRSIAWDKMDQAEFRAFADRAFEVIATDICPGLDAIALLEEGERETRIPDWVPP